MKTSKKLISIIVAVALLISTIAAVTTLTSSAATTKVSVWDGTTSVVQGGGGVVSNTKNPDGSVTIVTGETLTTQYQYQFKISSFDKEKIEAAGGAVKLQLTVNNAEKSTGDKDNGEVKVEGLAGGKNFGWFSGSGTTKTYDLDMSAQNWESSYNAIVFQNYSNGGGLKNVSVTIMFYVEEEATAETTTAGETAEETTADEAVETTTATPIAETTTVDPSTLVKKTFYSFKPTGAGDTFKTEGWYPGNGNWTSKVTLEPSYDKAGNATLSTVENGASVYRQVNTDWKNVPSVVDQEVYFDFTNNLTKAVKLILQYDEKNPVTVAAGETKTIRVAEINEEKNVFNLKFNAFDADIPVGENQFVISAMYTLVPYDPDEPTTTEVTEPETEPQTTTKAVDPSTYTAGSVFSRYAEHHYSKSEGWTSDASNLGDLSSYINVDPKGAFSLKIDASVGMKSQQIYAWYSVNGTENSRAVKAIEEAKAGTGKLMFDITVNEAKDKNGKDTTVGFKYSRLAGKSLDDNHVVNLPTGKTTRIVVDVSDYDPANLKGDTDYHYQLFFKNANDWNGALSVLDLTMTPITVAVDPNAVVETTEAPTTTEAPVETTTEEEVPATTTEAVETTTEEVTVTKTNPTSDPEFKLFDPETDMDKFAIGLDGATGKVGDVVEISAHIANNPGLLCGTFVIKYDSDVLRPIVKDMGTDKVIDVTVGEVFPTVQSGPAADVLDEDGNKTGYQTSTFILENNDVADVTENGELFTFKFEIIAKPAYGNTTNIVFANYDETMFANTSDEALEPVYAEGIVEIEEDEPETTTETASEVETPDVTTTEVPTTVMTKPELVSEAAFAAYDESKFNIVVDAVEGKAGNTVDVNITLNNNPGLWSGTFFLAYDPAVINPVETPVDGADYSVVKFSNMNIAGVDVTDGFVIDYTVDDYTFKMLPVSFGNAAMSDFTANGNLATVTFEIADGAKADDFSNIVFVNYDETLFNNVNGDEVEFTIKEGKVTVLGEPTQPETTTGSDVPATTKAPEATTKAPVATTKAPAGADATTANANVETPDATTTASNGSDGSASDDVGTGAAAAPIAALAIAAGAAFVAFKARKK